jgi:hypothetical protein
MIVVSNLHFFRQSCLYNSGRPVLTGSCKLGEQNCSKSSDNQTKMWRFQWLCINCCKACKCFKEVSMVPKEQVPNNTIVPFESVDYFCSKDTNGSTGFSGPHAVHLFCCRYTKMFRWISRRKWLLSRVSAHMVILEGCGSRTLLALGKRNLRRKNWDFSHWYALT